MHLSPTHRQTGGRPAALPFCAGLLLLLLVPTAAFAQGKIAGQVTETGTGEPLAGVNVVLEGTQQGTTTDPDGNYVIVNVRPGTYTVVFSFIGFQTQRITDVRATTGQTTRLDAEMGEEVIEGQEIVVQAERPLVQKDLTASRKTVVAEEIEALPVEGFFGVLATQAGVTQGADGAFHIRGGRSNEISYLVDGMSVGNPFNTNGLATEVAADAIQEMTVISGAFNAEYGKAMSGIVNLVTKEGGDRFEGSASVYGGSDVTGRNDLFMTPSGLRLNTYTLEGTLSGPVPFVRGLRFFVSGRRDVDDGHIYGVRQHLPSDSANFNPDPDRLARIRQFIPDYNGPAWYYELHGKPWYEYEDPSQIPGEVVALNPRESYNLLAKLSLRPFRGAKVEYSFLRDGLKRTPFGAQAEFEYRYNPDGLAQERDWSYNHSLHWTHTLDDRTFYTLRASYASNAFRSYVYEDPFDPRYVVDRSGAGNGNVTGFPGTSFLFGGNQKGHVYEDARSFRTKLDLTRQIGLIHEAKAGFDVQLHGMDRREFTVLYDGVRYRQPTVERPDQSPSHDVYEDQRVTELAAYVQDKLEFEDFIINVGFRYERFDPHGTYVADLLNPKESRAEATPKNMYLPRVGVSFPITERGIIHFSYGHFAQMPTLRDMYRNPEFEFPANAIPTYGNTNMRPERTVQYEVGLQQQLGDQLAFDVTGYYKDIRDYLTRQLIRFTTIPGEDQYRIYLNKDYANVKGVTFSLTKRRSRDGILSASVDYTYQVAEGNNDDTDAFFFNLLSGRENEFELVPLDFDQRHVLSSTVTLSRPGSWGLSFIGQYATGYPYSPLILDQNIDELPNSGRKPSQIKLDAHLYKDIRLGGVTARAFARVYNVLDVRNERFVHDDTGRATYSLSAERNLHATWEPAYGLPGIYTLDQWDTRPHWFNAPREVKLGVSLEF